MLGLLQKCFPQQVASGKWNQKLTEMIPSYGKSLAADAQLLKTVRDWTGRILHLPVPVSGGSQTT